MTITEKVDNYLNEQDGKKLIDRPRKIIVLYDKNKDIYEVFVYDEVSVDVYYNNKMII